MQSIRNTSFLALLAVLALAALPEAAAQAPKPALTVDVDSAPRNRAYLTCINPSATGSGLVSCSTEAVPAGKIFVIETINAALEGSGVLSSSGFRVVSSTFDPPTAYIPFHQPSSPGTLSVVTPFRMYYSAGASMNINANFTNGAGTPVILYFTAYGYYVKTTP